MSNQAISPSFKVAIEIEPYAYSDRESPMGKNDGPVSDEMFAQYLDNCLIDAGFEHLIPVAQGSMFYAIDALDDRSISTLVGFELEHWPGDEDYTNPENVHEYGSSFSGGMVIWVGGELVSYPGCCCSLNSLPEWEQVVAKKPSDWTNVWTGHDRDSVELRFDSMTDCFEFRVSEWETGNWDRNFTINAMEFQTQIEQLLQSRRTLAGTISKVVSDNFVGEAVRRTIGNRIAGIE